MDLREQLIRSEIVRFTKSNQNVIKTNIEYFGNKGSFRLLYYLIKGERLENFNITGGDFSFGEIGNIEETDFLSELDEHGFTDRFCRCEIVHNEENGTMIMTLTSNTHSDLNTTTTHYTNDVPKRVTDNFELSLN